MAAFGPFVVLLLLDSRDALTKPHLGTLLKSQATRGAQTWLRLDDPAGPRSPGAAHSGAVGRAVRHADVGRHRVAAWTTRAAGLQPVTAAARPALTGAELVHPNETGPRMAGQLHVATSAQFTGLFCHRRRGKEAIDAAGVLPQGLGKA